MICDRRTPASSPHPSGTTAIALATALGLVLGGCATGTLSDDAGRHDGGGTGDPSALVVMGENVAARYSCGTCHTSHDPADGILSGQTTPQPGSEAYPANLTPDPDTGLGTWTDDDIVRAVREGIDDQGEMLCVMPTFSQMTDAEAAALVAYLRSLQPVRRVIPESVCPMPDAGTGPDVELIRDDGPRDAGTPDAGTPDTGVPDVVSADVPGSTDAGMPDAGPRDAGMPDTGTPDAGTPDTGSPCTPVFTINEVQVGGATASDEFIEIYNSADCDGSLDGYFLAYSSSQGTTWQNKWTGQPTDVVPARGYVVIGGAGYAGPVIGRLSGSTGSLAGAGGGIGLVDPTLLIVDSVGYGATATNMFVEASPAAAPPAGQSIARHPDGADSDDNSVDFAVVTPTPGAAN